MIRHYVDVVLSEGFKAQVVATSRQAAVTYKVGFWKNQAMHELLTRTLVRDLDRVRICRPGTERDLAQHLVALAKENHENLTRS